MRKSRITHNKSGVWVAKSINTLQVNTLTRTPAHEHTRSRRTLTIIEIKRRKRIMKSERQIANWKTANGE